MSKSSRQTVLVTGATGTTGSALLRLLEERGFALRAMIRHKQDVAKLGNTSASIVIGDFDDAGSIAAAFLRYHAAVERRILELGLGYTFLRPNLFFQGLLAFKGLVEDYAHYARGEATEVYPTIREVARTVPRDVSAFAGDYASAFGSSATRTR
jgi:uncharacterized protein YbjT (DUF2867 family)